MEQGPDNHANKFRNSPIGRALRYLWILIGAFFLLFMLRGCFYLPSEERIFVDRIQKAFQATDKTWISVSDVTDFDWDRVCGFGYYTYPDAIKALTARYILFTPFPQDAPKVFAERTGYDRSVFEGHVPRNGWFNFSGAHLFFNNGQIVRQYIYTRWYIPMYNGRETFTFMREHATEGDVCVNFDNAAFYFDNTNKRYEPYMVLTDKHKISVVQ